MLVWDSDRSRLRLARPRLRTKSSRTLSPYSASDTCRSSSTDMLAMGGGTCERCCVAAAVSSRSVPCACSSLSP